MTRRIAYRGIVTLVLAGFAHAAQADAASEAVRRAMQSRFGGADRVEAVNRVSGTHIYEVVIRDAEGARILYADERASVILVGQMFDAKSGRNLTEERLQKLNAVSWHSLPFEWAVTTTRGSGRRKIAVFSDPNCPYCKRFEKNLAKLDDITVYIFLYPVIKPESVAQTKSVWCSADRAKAWSDLMLRDIQPTASPDCETPIEKLVALGHRIGANSTPTWFLENGRRYHGASAPEEVKRLLDAAWAGR